MTRSSWRRCLMGTMTARSKMVAGKSPMQASATGQKAGKAAHLHLLRVAHAAERLGAVAVAGVDEPAELFALVGLGPEVGVGLVEEQRRVHGLDEAEHGRHRRIDSVETGGSRAARTPQAAGSCRTAARGRRRPGAGVVSRWSAKWVCAAHSAGRPGRLLRGERHIGEEEVENIEQHRIPGPGMALSLRAILGPQRLERGHRGRVGVGLDTASLLLPFAVTADSARPGVV